MHKNTNAVCRAGQFFSKIVYSLFRCVLASLYEGLSVGQSVRPSVGPSVGDAFVKNGKIDDFDRK